MDTAEFVEAHGAEVRRAAARISGHVRRTPLLASELHDGLLIKAESLQVTGAFKARGAMNAVLALREREPAATGVVAVSSGNHAQAIAWAAARLGLAATIVIPEGANPAKVAATRALGAEVISDGVTNANREEVVLEVQRRRGLPLVHPFDDWDVIHGQGTAALEVLQDAPAAGAIVTPVGGGGLLSGTAIVARGADPSIQAIGVEPAVADDAARSLATGSRVALAETPDTIADGVRSLRLGERGFETLVSRGLATAIVTVSEAELEEALRVAWTRLRLAVEPTAALPLAAWLAGRVPRGEPARPTVLVLTGGNFDPAVTARVLSG